MSTHQQYVIKPPSIPLFLYKSNVSAWLKLIEWADREFRARNAYLIKHGYMRELNNLNRNWSPIRILAQLSGFRRLCSVISESTWNSLTKKERDFIRNAFELRELLLRQSVS